MIPNLEALIEECVDSGCAQWGHCCKAHDPCMFCEEAKRVKAEMLMLLKGEVA